MNPALFNTLMRSLSRLKGDYQVYLMQTMTYLCSHQMEEFFSSSIDFDFWQAERHSQKEDIVLNSMNIDLTMKMINQKIKHVQRQNNQKYKEIASSSLNRCYHELLASLI